jgi:hypothetical protein
MPAARRGAAWAAKYLDPAREPGGYCARRFSLQMEDLMLRRLSLFPLLCAIAAAPLAARAAFHEIKIVEVFAGGGSASQAQYVELQAYTPGQNFVNTHRVIIYDAAGTAVGQAQFPTQPSPAVNNGANQMSIFVATAQAASLFGISADLLLPSALIDRAGGKICWDALDCFAWGNYSGAAGAGGTAVGTPFPALQAGVAAHRRLDILVTGSPTVLENGDDTGNSATNFVAGFPSPRNNANAVGPEDLDGIAPAVDDCPFYPNPVQGDADQDGRGDDCECTDQNLDGANTVSDLVGINIAIFNPEQATPLCDGNDDGLCDVNDILAANIEIFSAGETSTCARQPVPGP